MSDEQQSVNILGDDKSPPSTEQDPNDPNVILGNILQSLSGFQMIFEAQEARIGQLERLVGYLLKNDQKFMENLQTAEAAAAEVTKGALAQTDGNPQA